jgi:hypothetical protein
MRGNNSDVRRHVKLVVGGGFGLFLLQNELALNDGIQTAWCVPISKADKVENYRVMLSMTGFIALDQT